MFLNRSTRNHVPRAADGRQCRSSLWSLGPRFGEGTTTNPLAGSCFRRTSHIRITVAGGWVADSEQRFCHLRGTRHLNLTRGFYRSNRSRCSLPREDFLAAASCSLNGVVRRGWRSDFRVSCRARRALDGDESQWLYNRTTLADPRECSTRAALQRGSSLLSFSWEIRRRSGRRRVAPTTRRGATLREELVRLRMSKL